MGYPSFTLGLIRRNKIKTKKGTRVLPHMRRPTGTPAIVFVDDTRWAAFHQLSPQLRSAGVRTIRVSLSSGIQSRITSRLVFDRYVTLRHDNDQDVLRSILREENVIDIQFIETLSSLVSNVLDECDDKVVRQVRRRLVLMDKWDAARVFSENGVRTPEVIELRAQTPEEISERFGLPVVVKERTGCGGSSVEICHDLKSLTLAHRDFSARASDCYYERFVVGEKVNYAATNSDHGLVQELAYRVTRWELPVGTATEVRTVSENSLMEFGRRAVTVADCRGLMNMDVIRDLRGEYWLIDFNARAFGGGMNFLVAGLDLSQGYLFAIGLRSERPVSTSPEDNRTVEIFPTVLSEVMQSGRYLRTMRAFFTSAGPYWQRLGFRYVVSEALSTLETTRTARRGSA